MDGSVATFPGGHFALSTGASLDALNANNATFSNGTTLPVVVVQGTPAPSGTAPSGTLASTGSSTTVLLVCLAAGLVLFGVTLVGIARRRHPLTS